jgi:hypothetical protein
MSELATPHRSSDQRTDFAQGITLADLTSAALLHYGHDV